MTYLSIKLSGPLSINNLCIVTSSSPFSAIFSMSMSLMLSMRLVSSDRPWIPDASSEKSWPSSNHQPMLSVSIFVCNCERKEKYHVTIIVIIVICCVNQFQLLCFLAFESHHEKTYILHMQTKKLISAFVFAT